MPARHKTIKIPLDSNHGIYREHFPFEVSAACVGLVSSPPERPCEDTVDRDAPLSELDSDGTDFLDRPADQERCLVCRRGGVFLSAGSALARWRMTAIMAKASM